LDGLLALLLAAIPAYLVYLQIRFHAIEGAWAKIQSATWKKVLFLSILFATFCRFTLHPGKFPMIVDHPYFLGAADEFWRSIKMGSFGNYSTLFYSGWNCRQYMGNLFAVLAGTFAFFTGSHFGIKLLLLITGTASGLGTFLWIERVTRRSYPAFFAGTAFCLNYWHYYQIFVVGQLHMSVIYACLPWPFYFLEAGLAQPRLRLRYFLLCALPLAGAVYTHFVWGAMLWGIFAVYAVVRLVGRLRGKERTLALRLFSVSFALEFLILAGLITAPLVQKKESVAYYTTRSFAAIPANPAMKIRPEVLYQWYNGHWSLGESTKGSNGVQSDFFNSYLGLVPLLFAILGLWGLSGKTGADRNALAFIVVCLAGSLALVFLYFDLVKIPGLSAFRIFPDHRYQTFVVFFMSAAAAFGVMGWRHWVRDRLTRWNNGLWGGAALVVGGRRWIHYVPIPVSSQRS
jgi:hypothetical protein